MIGKRALLTISVLMLVVMAAGAQSRRWFDLYDEAIQHIARREWALAETKLKQAQQNGPAPGRRVLRTGMFRDDFFPDFYLGVVYLNTNRPKEALQQFQLARSQNVNAQDKEFLPIATYEAQAQRDAQRSAANTTEPPKPVNPIPPDTAKPDTAKPTEVVPPAPPDLSADRKRLEAQFEQAIQGRNAGAARAALLELQKVQPDPKVVATYTTRINSLDREIRLAASERSAMEAYFAGNYQKAVASLNAIEREAGPLSPRGYFYRACGLAAQALRTPQVDTKALMEARRQYGEAMKSRQVIAPDRRYVSPRILQALGS